MKTKVIPSSQGSKLERLTPKQHEFVNELVRDPDWNVTRVAEKLGMKQRTAAALMSRPDVQRALGKILYDREMKGILKQNEVLEFLKTGLMFNPLKLFQATEDGTWRISEQAIMSMPDEIGRLIESFKAKTVVDAEGNETRWLEVKMISKTKMLELAMQHLGLLGVGGKAIAGMEKPALDLSPLYQPLSPDDDVIEVTIRQAGG